jgi:hypothetical protein
MVVMRRSAESAEEEPEEEEEEEEELEDPKEKFEEGEYIFLSYRGSIISIQWWDQRIRFNCFTAEHLLVCGLDGRSQDYMWIRACCKCKLPLKL